MACVSLSRSPLASDLDSRSLPARSIRFSMPAHTSAVFCCRVEALRLRDLGDGVGSKRSRPAVPYPPACRTAQHLAGLDPNSGHRVQMQALACCTCGVRIGRDDASGASGWVRILT